MVKIYEFYPEKQGMPFSPVVASDGKGFSLGLWSVRGIHLAGEFSKTEQTDDYTAGNEMVILAEGDITVTLPPAATSMSKVYWIKNVGLGTVTIKPNSTDELIDDYAELNLTLQGSYVMIICSGTKVVNSYWHIIGGMNMKLEDLFNKWMSENSELLKQILTETRQETLHLAKLSGEKVTAKDVQWKA